MATESWDDIARDITALVRNLETLRTGESGPPTEDAMLAARRLHDVLSELLRGDRSMAAANHILSIPVVNGRPTPTGRDMWFACVRKLRMHGWTLPEAVHVLGGTGMPAGLPATDPYSGRPEDRATDRRHPVPGPQLHSGAHETCPGCAADPRVSASDHDGILAMARALAAGRPEDRA